MFFLVRRKESAINSFIEHKTKIIVHTKIIIDWRILDKTYLGFYEPAIAAKQMIEYLPNLSK